MASGFAALAHAPFKDDVDSPQVFNSPASQTQLGGLPTIPSGGILPPAKLEEPSSAKQRRFPNLFRMNSSKRKDALDLSEGELSSGPSKSETAAQRPAANGASPKKSWLSLPRASSSKTAAGPVAASPPDSPRQPSADSAPSNAAQPQVKAARFLLRSKSDMNHRKSASLDSRDLTHNGSVLASEVGAVGQERYNDLAGSLQGPGLGAKLQMLPSAPPIMSLQRTNSSQPKGQHKRSKSSGQALEQGMAGLRTTEKDAPAATSGLMKMLSCVTPPKTGDDEGDAVQSKTKPEPKPEPKPAEPNAPLVNPGNLCFYTSVMQCLYNTKGLPQMLCRTFPDVPEPPGYAQHEPLSEFVLPGARPLSAAPSLILREEQCKADAAAGKPDGVGQASSEPPSTRNSMEGSIASLVVKQLDSDSHLHNGKSSNPSSLLSTGSSKSFAASENGDQAQPGDDGQHPDAAFLSRSSPTAPALQGAEPSDAALATNVPDLPTQQALDQEASPREASPSTGNGVCSSLAPSEASTADKPAQSSSSQPVTPRNTQAREPERDRRVWEMSQRAAAAAVASGDSDAIIIRRLSLAMAHVMGKMAQSKTPVNPLPAVYFAAQHSRLGSQLIDGQQQDVHELWIQLMDLLTDDSHSYVEAGGNLKDIFEGTLRTTTSCRRCSDTATREPEAFCDLILSLPKLGSVSVDSCLSTYCSPSNMPSAECSKCKADPDASASSKNVFEKFQDVFSRGKEEGKTAKISFEQLPSALVVQLNRCIVLRNGDSFTTLQKSEAAVKVNMILQVRKHLSDSAPRQLKQEEAGKDAEAGLKRVASETGRKKSASGEASREEGGEYRLYAVILHKGHSQHRGHYYAMCRVGSLEDDWYLFDDHHKPVSMSSRGRSDKYLNLTECEKREVCMLFYERLLPSAASKAKN